MPVIRLEQGDGNRQPDFVRSLFELAYVLGFVQLVVAGHMGHIEPTIVVGIVSTVLVCFCAFSPFVTRVVFALRSTLRLQAISRPGQSFARQRSHVHA